jgi:HD-like signal output (HDOD) protein
MKSVDCLQLFLTPRELANEVSSLFSLPDLVIRACTVMESPTASVQDLIEVIELDANLTATVLRLANSALYGSRGKIETLTRAVALIGHNALRDLVLATAAVNTFRDIPAEFVDMNTFWDNSTTSAMLARLLADRLRMRDGESLFLAGLLLGVGRLVFYVRRPAQYREALEHAREISLADAERRVFGFSHADLGAALLESWGLPEKLTLAVRYQLDPTATPDFAKEVALIHLAGDLAANLAPCLKTEYEPETYRPDSRATDSMQLLGLSPATLKEISLEGQVASLEISEILHPCTSVTY